MRDQKKKEKLHAILLVVQFIKQVKMHRIVIGVQTVTDCQLKRNGKKQRAAEQAGTDFRGTTRIQFSMHVLIIIALVVMHMTQVQHEVIILLSKKVLLHIQAL